MQKIKNRGEHLSSIACVRVQESCAMRHRSGKHDIDLNPSSTDVFGAHNHSKQSVGTHRAERNLHNGVWIRIICILIFVTFSVLIVARISEVHVDSVLNPRNKLSEIEKHILHAPAPSFVTIVMPSVVKPEARPLRLTNIAKTWGPSSNAIYVVHNTNEFPEAERNQVGKSSITGHYPQILLVPEDITVDMGVPRLQYVMRTISRDVDPDFAFFVNDHTFVLPNNLCKYLREQDSSKDLYSGHALKGKQETAFNSGAAGYVLSRKTITDLIKEWDAENPLCSAAGASKWLQGNPGLLTAKCFDEALHIQLPDTRDENQSHKFHAYGLVRTVTGKVDDWYINKHAELDFVLGVDNLSHHKLKKGAMCCSPSTISFHYVEAGESLVFWDVLKKSRESPSMSESELKDLMMKTWPRDREGLGGYAHGLPSPLSLDWIGLTQVVKKISDGVGSVMC